MMSLECDKHNDSLPEPFWDISCGPCDEYSSIEAWPPMSNRPVDLKPVIPEAIVYERFLHSCYRNIPSCDVFPSFSSCTLNLSSSRNFSAIGGPESKSKSVGRNGLSSISGSLIWRRPVGKNESTSAMALIVRWGSRRTWTSWVPATRLSQKRDFVLSRVTVRNLESFYPIFGSLSKILCLDSALISGRTIRYCLTSKKQSIHFDVHVRGS